MIHFKNGTSGSIKCGNIYNNLHESLMNYDDATSVNNVGLTSTIHRGFSLQSKPSNGSYETRMLLDEVNHNICIGKNAAQITSAATASTA